MKEHSLKIKCNNIFNTNRYFYRQCILAVLLTLVVNSFTVLSPWPVYGQRIHSLSQIGILKPTARVFHPPLIKGIKTFADNPFRFDFIVDPGQKQLTQEQLKNQSQTLIKYFLAALAVPDEELWVNLSPYESDRVIPQDLGQTEMGRDLLMQDYVLKQMTASFLYPEENLGDQFWQNLHAKAQTEYGAKDLPMDSFHKVWIVPETAVVYEDQEWAYVEETSLKVMLENDYLTLSNHEEKGIQKNTTNHLQTQMIRELILPAIEKEVNQGEAFATLRQIYHAVILAGWFKMRLHNHFLQQAYVDQQKIFGVDIQDKQAAQKIYQRYLQAFRDGVYDYVKEDYDPMTQQIVSHKYFSGGFSLSLSNNSNPSMLTIRSNEKGFARKSVLTLVGISAFVVSAIVFDPWDKSTDDAPVMGDNLEVVIEANVDVPLSDQKRLIEWARSGSDDDIKKFIALIRKNQWRLENVATIYALALDNVKGKKGQQELFRELRVLIKDENSLKAFETKIMPSLKKSTKKGVLTTMINGLKMYRSHFSNRDVQSDQPAFNPYTAEPNLKYLLSRFSEEEMKAYLEILMARYYFEGNNEQKKILKQLLWATYKGKEKGFMIPVKVSQEAAHVMLELGLLNDTEIEEMIIGQKDGLFLKSLFETLESLDHPLWVEWLVQYWVEFPFPKMSIVRQDLKWLKERIEGLDFRGLNQEQISVVQQKAKELISSRNRMDHNLSDRLYVLIYILINVGQDDFILDNFVTKGIDIRGFGDILVALGRKDILDQMMAKRPEFVPLEDIELFRGYSLSDTSVDSLYMVLHSLDQTKEKKYTAFQQLLRLASRPSSNVQDKEKAVQYLIELSDQKENFDDITPDSYSGKPYIQLMMDALIASDDKNGIDRAHELFNKEYAKMKRLEGVEEWYKPGMANNFLSKYLEKLSQSTTPHAWEKIQDFPLEVMDDIESYIFKPNIAYMAIDDRTIVLSYFSILAHLNTEESLAKLLSFKNYGNEVNITSRYILRDVLKSAGMPEEVRGISTTVGEKPEDLQHMDDLLSSIDPKDHHHFIDYVQGQTIELERAREPLIDVIEEIQDIHVWQRLADLISAFAHNAREDQKDDLDALSRALKMRFSFLSQYFDLQSQINALSEQLDRMSMYRFVYDQDREGLWHLVNHDGLLPVIRGEAMSILSGSDQLNDGALGYYQFEYPDVFVQDVALGKDVVYRPWTRTLENSLSKKHFRSQKQSLMISFQENDPEQIVKDIRLLPSQEDNMRDIGDDLKKVLADVKTIDQKITVLEVMNQLRMEELYLEDPFEVLGARGFVHTFRLGLFVERKLSYPEDFLPMHGEEQRYQQEIKASEEFEDEVSPAQLGEKTDKATAVGGVDLSLSLLPLDVRTGYQKLHKTYFQNDWHTFPDIHLQGLTPHIFKITPLNN